MESFGLYEDLSLFHGDLLSGVDPLANEFPLSMLDSDGDHLELTKLCPSVDLFAEKPKPQPQDPENDDNWMDKKMDLIKWFSSPNVEVTIQEEPLSFSEIGLAPYLEAASHNHTSYSDNAPLTFEPVEMEGPDLLENMTNFLSLDLVDPTTIEPASSFSSFTEEFDFSTGGLASLLVENENVPILSPVSSEDVESILSSGPTSPISSASINDVPEIQTIDLNILVNHGGESSIQNHSAVGPMRPIRPNRGRKYKPYDDIDRDFERPAKKSRGHRISDRKERKKQQNKDAALRYRQKKKDELSSVFDQCDALEDKNTELKDKVDDLDREIKYVKDLLSEVYKANGKQLPPILLSSK